MSPLKLATFFSAFTFKVEEKKTDMSATLRVRTRNVHTKRLGSKLTQWRTHLADGRLPGKFDQQREVVAHDGEGMAPVVVGRDLRRNAARGVERRLVQRGAQDLTPADSHENGPEERVAVGEVGVQQLWKPKNLNMISPAIRNQWPRKCGAIDHG
jgi:hypothetical protein